MTQQSDHFSRHAGFELLRIISMMMIVLMHGIGHGGLGTNRCSRNVSLFYLLAPVHARTCLYQLLCHADRLFYVAVQNKGIPAVSDRNTGFVLFSADLCDRSVCQFCLSICRQSAACCFSGHLLCILVLLLLFHIVSCDPAVK